MDKDSVQFRTFSFTLVRRCLILLAKTGTGFRSKTLTQMMQSATQIPAQRAVTQKLWQRS